jgi:hypothetical protein
LFGKKTPIYCANCNKELTHKYKPSEEWNMIGFLCAECHIEKTKEFVLKKEEEKMRLEKDFGNCSTCGKQFVSKSEKNQPRWQWNMEPGTMLCKSCHKKKEADYQKKLNLCAVCDKKMGFIRYNPKPKWKVDGQLCRQCWDEQNQIRK